MNPRCGDGRIEAIGEGVRGVCSCDFKTPAEIDDQQAWTALYAHWGLDYTTAACNPVNIDRAQEAFVARTA